MKVFVGLGNPGREYEKTRHNVGFLVIDALAQLFNAKLTKEKFYGTWAESHGEHGKCGLLKPQTYMNLSGQSVAKCLQFYRVPIGDLLVVHDDIDLVLGTLKLAWNRGAAGHRGVDSVIEHLGTREFWRLRVGVGRPPSGHDPSDYVLQPFASAEREQVTAVVQQAADAARRVYAVGPEAAQQFVHGQ